MIVSIKDKEMPENCQECFCLNDEYFYCQAMSRKPSDENVIQRRPDWCPLIEIPSDDVAERKRGAWIPVSNGNVKNWKKKCSICGSYYRGTPAYCPNCGARMVEDDEA